MTRFCKMIWYLIISLSIAFNAYANDFLLGIGVHPQSFPGGANSVIEHVTSIKANSIRTDYPWNQVEKARGEYTTPNKNIEESISLALENHITPVLILGYGNSIYTEKSIVNPRMKPIGEQAVSAYINYVKWTAEHFKDKEVIYEIWNEWVQGGAGGKKITLSKASLNSYSNLINKTCHAIKKINKNSTVIIGSTSPFDSKSNQWLEKLISVTDMNCVDGISFHAYHYYPQIKEINAKSVVNKMEELQYLLKRKSKENESIPFYITEIGVPNIVRAKYTEYDIKAYFDELIPLLNAKHYIKGVWWYDLIDDGNDRNNIEHNFGLFRSNKQEKPIVEAFHSIAESLKKDSTGARK